MEPSDYVILFVCVALVFSFHTWTKSRPAPQIPPEDLRNATRFELLETKISGIKTEQRKLSSEWTDYHSKLDTLVRRGIRLGVLDRNAAADRGNDEVPPVTAQPTRATILAEFRRRDAATKSNS